MKQTFAYLFLILYSYNLAGYILVFSVRQTVVRNEIRSMLKESAPESDLILLTFHTSSLKQGKYPLRWIEDHEFRYAGAMYDIVRSHSSGDSTQFLCFNDTLEEALFADLDSHVQRGMSNHSAWLDAVMDLFETSFTDFHPPTPSLMAIAINGPPVQALYESVVSNVIPPPPRSHPVA
jgi:hypothetical protein